MPACISWNPRLAVRIGRSSMGINATAQVISFTAGANEVTLQARYNCGGANSTL